MRYPYVFATAVLSTFFISSAINAETFTKYALLIGITEYEHSKMNEGSLKFPESDAIAVSDLLLQSGYKVDLLLGSDATKSRIGDALKKAGQQGTQGGVVLIGLYGHGVQYGQMAYFCPYDTKLKILKLSDGSNATDSSGKPILEAASNSLVSMSDILQSLSTCGASNRILMADCCRNDPNRARGRNAFGSSFQAKDLPTGTAAFFACQKGEQAYEHDQWEHGAFTFAFLKHANELASDGAVTSGTLSDKIYTTVRQIVKEKTGKPQQTVYCLSSGRVDFVLEPKNAMANGNTKAQPIRPPVRMLDVYQTNHAGAGAELIDQPDNRILLNELFNPKSERLVNGSEVVVEELADCKSGGPLKWARIRVVSGLAKGKTGWTGVRNLKLTDKKIKDVDVGANPQESGKVKTNTKTMESKNGLTKPKANKDLHSFNLSNTPAGPVPESLGWKTQGDIRIIQFAGRKFAGMPASISASPRSGTLEVTDLWQAGDYTVRADYFAPDGGQLTLELIDLQNNFLKVILDCGRPRSGRIRNWYITNQGAAKQKFVRSSDNGILSICREGNRFAITLDNEYVGQMDATNFGALSGLRILTRSARDPAGLTSLSVLGE